ncbi:Kinesin motor family protein [Perilla frutescens var. hirtella]|uniref:Kinesin motor family protein n=1 Tax=Perilla frutescens var. hirtella TaxID=608512 RepID=A0AAD4IUF0_PERFH|nr:Kinesin motor family protein [Perilla frutescens var. hirtella]
MTLMTQCSEKGFELEIKSADNRVLQEQLQMKCAENKEMEDKILHLEQQLASISSGNKSYPSENCVHDEYSEELRKKVQSQENSGLHVQNKKLAEEASYAKELASAAAVELKNLAGDFARYSMLMTI